jgi:hypothetical protein
MSFMPTWSPPNVTAGACATDQDIADAYDKCFAPPVDANACNAYKMAKASCFTCISSNDSDAKHGPLVWAAGMAYFTVNVAGCVAIEQKDASAGSCAAAFDAAIECKRSSCASCASGANIDFSQLSMCENAAGKTGVCMSLGSTEGMKCGDLQGPDASTSACFESSGETLRDLYLRVAPLFCK